MHWDSKEHKCSQHSYLLVAQVSEWGHLQKAKYNHYLQILTVAKRDVTQRKKSTEVTSHQEKTGEGGTSMASGQLHQGKGLRNKFFFKWHSIVQPIWKNTQLPAANTYSGPYCFPGLKDYSLWGGDKITHTCNWFLHLISFPRASLTNTTQITQTPYEG